MHPKRKSTIQGFTLVELLTTLVIIALLVALSVVYIPSMLSWVMATKNKQTLITLNTALDRYKTEGGNINVLTLSAPPSNTLKRIATTIKWNGMEHLVLSPTFTLQGRSLITRGSGKTYRFIAYNGTETETVNTPLKRSSLVKSVYAGTVSPGNTNGPLLSAQFVTPQSMIMDSSGNIYVADWGNHSIRKITPAGIVSTFAYLGAGASPCGMAFGPDGNIYVGCTGTYVIKRVTMAGIVSVYAGTGVNGSTNGTVSSANMRPYGICFDSAGNLYYTEYSYNTLKRITTSGIVSTLYTGALTTHPVGLTYDSAYNSIIVISSGSNIAKWSIAGASISTPFPFSGGSLFGIINGDTLYYTNAGNVKTVAVSGGTSSVLSDSYSVPTGLVFDRSGNLIVSQGWTTSANQLFILSNP